MKYDYARVSTDHQQAEAIKRRDAGEPMRDIGKSFNVSHSTISRL
jgi:DNA invertase Pin-like site-specific DNA recombinase